MRECVSEVLHVHILKTYFDVMFNFYAVRSGFSDTATLFSNFHVRAFNLRSIHFALFLYLTVSTCWAGKEIIFIQEKRQLFMTIMRRLIRKEWAYLPNFETKSSIAVCEAPPHEKSTTQL